MLNGATRLNPSVAAGHDGCFLAAMCSHRFISLASAERNVGIQNDVLSLSICAVLMANVFKWAKHLGKLSGEGRLAVCTTVLLQRGVRSGRGRGSRGYNAFYFDLSRKAAKPFVELVPHTGIS